MRGKWPYILIPIAVPVLFFLIVPVTRVTFIGYLSGDAIASDGMPVSYHTRQLLGDDPEVSYESLKMLLKSYQCALQASPKLVAYFKELRNKGKSVTSVTFSTTAHTLENGSKEKVQTLVPVLREMLLCESEDPIHQAEILDRITTLGVRDELINQAAVKMLWSKLVISINTAAKTLNASDPDVLKREIRLMLADPNKMETGQSLKREYFPNMPD